MLIQYSPYLPYLRNISKFIGLIVLCVLTSGLFAAHDKALLTAASDNNTAGAEQAIKKGANVNAVDEFGRTVLRMAVEKKNTALVRLLIAGRVNLNAAPDPDNVTALMVAAANGDSEMIRLLLNANADVNFRNKAGRTALGVALIQGKHGAARTLKDAGGTEAGHAGAANTQTATASKAKRKNSGIPEIEKLLDACMLRDEAKEESCQRYAECIAQTIYNDQSRCTDMWHNCTSHFNSVQSSAVRSCQQKFKISTHRSSESEAINVAKWAMSNRKEEASSPGRPNNSSPGPREKTENEKWRSCHASGQSGCGYR